MRNSFHSFTIPAILLMALSACGSHKENNALNSAAPNYKTLALQRGQLNRAIRLPGELKPFEEVDIYAKVNSFVKEVLVDRGTSVKKGQELMLLDAPELEAQYREAQNKLKSKESTLRSTVSYYRRLLLTSRTPGTVSQNDLEQAESKMSSDSSEVASLRSAFQAMSELKNYLVVKAPFDGIISERNVHPGAFVGPAGKGSDQPMLRLEEEGMLRLIVAVPEIHTGAISEKQVVRFQVKAYPSDTFSATVKRISGSLDRKTRTELIEMDAANKDHRLLPGMYAEVELGISRAEQSFIVPVSAVFSNTEGVFIIEVKNGKARRVSIKKGNENGGMVEIFGELHENDQVLQEGSDQISEGQALNTL